MIRAILFPANKDVHRTLKLEEIPNALKKQDDLIWVDIANPSEKELVSILSGIFHFHPLTIEDCLHNGYQSPKIDDFGSYIFIISHAIDREHAFPYLFSRELNLYLGPNYLVTHYSKENMPPVEAVMQRMERDERLVSNGSDFLCHAVLDALVDEYVPLLDEVEDETELLEERVLVKPAPATLERLVLLKHGVLAMHRLIAPMREIINRLSRDPFPMIDMQSRIYFRDIYDHLTRIEDTISLVRDMVGSAQEMYLNASSMRMNEVMKALTIVSTIFLPLSFVAGVYGMNFHYFPELSWRYGYLFTWLIFISITIAMLIYFKRRGWF